MANHNVIDCTPFGKYPSLTANVYPFQNWHYVREDEGDYGEDQSTKDQTLRDTLQALLDKPLWPQFPDGAYLNSTQAARLYRATQAIQGITHILDRSANYRGLNKDYDHEPERFLSEVQESQLRMALIEIGSELVNLADDLHQRVLENT